MAETVIKQVAQDVWTFSRPFARMGIIPFGGRSTVIKLRDGNVWVLASTPLEDATKTKIDQLGALQRYIVGPDAVHYLYLSARFKKAYPQAKVIGVEPLKDKKGVPKLDGVYGVDPSETKYGFEDEVQSCYFSAFAKKDVAFNHIASKSLIEADLLFNLPAREQYSTTQKKPFLYNHNFGPSSWLHQKLLWLAGSNTATMKKDVQTVASWDFDRIIPCHGDVIEDKAKEAWKTAFSAYLK
ncbi:hypothetical protein M422DRAFT_267638 [Sphaerobolus stellatus SS14]|uniref:DUF4336 domain-containing protein n=1 Tax=Sphaerobolus stellatus (strain SS14) TaxID=990650 RepID=A0A0C9UPE3_SPHS4|nr:hypothetical protein M422DRAFT_267638 [Sphaerobolus stellatus SS14]